MILWINLAGIVLKIDDTSQEINGKFENIIGINFGVAVTSFDNLSDHIILVFDYVRSRAWFFVTALCIKWPFWSIDLGPRLDARPPDSYTRIAFPPCGAVGTVHWVTKTYNRCVTEISC
jgi:hypothetical protein